MAAPDVNPAPAVRLRPALDAIPSYKPGRPPEARDGVTTYKISSNENPYPPLPSVLSVVEGAAASMNRYPDMFATALTEAIADHLGVLPEQVATGTGSVGVLGQIVQATCADGDEVVYAWRSFEAYPIVVGISGARAVQVPLTADARHDLDAMAGAVTPATRLVLVCTPNNPTGPAVRRAELEAFLDRVPPDVLVVVDEAYREFVRDPEVPDALDVWRSRPNVVVLRTFSKAYGLAGLRVGYAVAHEPVADALRKTSVPFGVSSLAQEAAVASLRAEAELLERVAALVGERTRVLGALRDQGWPVPDSEANFVWVPAGGATADFAAACGDVGLSVRPFPGDGARCTVAETEANDRLIEVCARFVRHAAPHG
ncbi:MAG TPA: histidinol-phosphate transaminase [Actinomycetales bacterium]|nr:histidinol-phosphate transaminase [Actinomycetales bacterium]